MNSSDEPSRALPVEAGAQPLAVLIARVEAATGPDREVERDLGERFYSDILTRERRVIHSGQFAWMHPDCGLTRCEPYTASLDAALALVERVLPEWAWSVGNLKSGAQAYLMHGQGAELIAGAGATPALALILALLRALQGDARHDR